ncbi:MAG: hypothetical protein GYA55_07345 [SAR324 cluster bacterium]|uniref:Uncharacterized protein n=1 Tax=SAR324 cluster bacterium TaxID=2024889 RepID=A0A7X9IKB8_9DELT|nr:hypothetical protein [SAR324 cluster bacterium]
MAAPSLNLPELIEQLRRIFLRKLSGRRSKELVNSKEIDQNDFLRSDYLIQAGKEETTRSLIISIAITVLALDGGIAKATVPYNGTFASTMKVNQTSCLDLKVGDSRTIELLIAQNKKLLTASPAKMETPVVVALVNYIGFVRKGGTIMSLVKNYPVVPESLSAQLLPNLLLSWMQARPYQGWYGLALLGRLQTSSIARLFI